LTKLAMKKATTYKTIQQYSYLRIGQQICYSHYMSIVENFQEWTYRREDIPIPRLSINKLSLEDWIKKMTTVLYKKRNNGLILDPKEFDKMLVAADLI
ncbi:22141_t:CDS:1, partial [Dentiscutata erythropus]